MAKLLTLEFGNDGFAIIRMVNGENRFRTETIHEWNRMLDQVLENKDVKGLLITGSDKFFSNGIDLTWISKQRGKAAAEYIPLLHSFMRRVLVFPVPTVALINGHAFGAGAFLSIACDYRVMRPDKGWLCWPETALGMQFGEPLLQLARTKIPPGTIQREALLFAKRLTGSMAKDLGLVDVLTDESKLIETGKSLVNSALGPRGLERGIVQQNKKDLYSNVIDFSKL